MLCPFTTPGRSLWDKYLALLFEIALLTTILESSNCFLAAALSFLCLFFSLKFCKAVLWKRSLFLRFLYFCLFIFFRRFFNKLPIMYAKWFLVSLKMFLSGSCSKSITFSGNLLFKFEGWKDGKCILTMFWSLVLKYISILLDKRLLYAGNLKIWFCSCKKATFKDNGGVLVCRWHIVWTEFPKLQTKKGHYQCQSRKTNVPRASVINWKGHIQ